MARRTGDALALVGVAALAALAAAPAAAAAAGVRVQASADRLALGQDETLTLTVRVESDEEPSSLELPEAELPFAVVSRARSGGTTFSLRGGRVRARRTTELRLVLAPRRTGELLIPPVVAIVGGARHATAPLRVKVHAAGAGPGTPGAPGRRGGTWSGWERDLVLRVELDRREAFVGEQVTASVWLLSPAGVVAYEGYRPPAYDGFWVEEVETPQRLAHRVRDVGGVPTRAYLVQRLALFPTRAGAVELGPYQLDVAIRVGTDSLLSPGDVRRARRRSAPVTLRVKPLPPGAPDGFETVNVGSLRLEASASAAEVPAGEPVTIRIAASGAGNVRARSLPELPELAGVRRFAPTAAVEVKAAGTRLGGTRAVETVVVPERPGTLVVPPLSWPFFDPRSGRYEVARTQALRVEVLPGRGAGEAPQDPVAAAALPPRRDGVPAPRPPPPWRRLPFVLLLAAPPLALAALAAVDARRRRAAADAPARRARGAGARARERLRLARRRLGEGDRGGALDEIERALAGFAADRLGAPVAGRTRGELAEALAGAGARPAGIAALAAALDACDAARFGGGAVPEAEVLGRAEAAVALLDGGGEERP